MLSKHQPSSVISIHTPLAGSDPAEARQRAEQAISIHTPLAGSDRSLRDRRRHHPISIHPPLAGSDFQAGARPCVRIDFNPHSPCGERQSSR